MSRTIIAIGFMLAAGTASAQTGSNVVGSRAENQVGAINQSILSQQQNRAAAQQNQFETNQLRNQASRPSTEVIAPGIGTPVPGRR